MLTRRQNQLLHFLAEYLVKSDGISPTFDEMRAALGLRSKSGIHRLLTGLEERGFIQRWHTHARAIAVVKMPEFVCATPAEDLATAISGMLGKYGLATTRNVLAAHLAALERAPAEAA